MLVVCGEGNNGDKFRDTVAWLGTLIQPRVGGRAS
jgi:hypothetical protein